MSTFRSGWLTALYYLVGVPTVIAGYIFGISQLGKLVSGELAGAIFGGVGLLTLYVFLLFVRDIGRLIRTKEQHFAQRRRDSKATELRERLAAQSAKPTLAQETQEAYYLYLRPFESTGVIRVMIRDELVYPRGPVLGARTPLESTHWADLETILAQIVEPSGPLIALGAPGEQIGAGRLACSDERWRAEFLFLAARARALFVVPSSHQGTTWEIIQVLEREPLLRKTIFLIPPSPQTYRDTPEGRSARRLSVHEFGVKTSRHGDDVGRAAGIRRRAIEVMCELGVTLPNDDGQGMLLVLGAARSILAFEYMASRREGLMLALYDWWLGQNVQRFSVRRLRKVIGDLEAHTGRDAAVEPLSQRLRKRERQRNLPRPHDRGA